MVALARRFSWVVAIDLVLAAPAYAQSINETQMDLIAKYADKICGQAATKGEAQSSEMQGELHAQLQGLAKNLLDVGGSGSGKLASSAYENVAREDLAANLHDVRGCRLKMFDSLKAAAILPGPPQYHDQSSQPSSTPNPKPQLGRSNSAPPVTEGDMSRSNDPRARFGPSAVRFKGKEITVSNCGVGGCGVTVRFSVENASGVDIEAALRRGSISVGSCTNIETTSSGLPYAFGAGSERMTWSNMANPTQPRFVAAGARIEATIATPYSNCTDTLRGIQTTDLSMSIAVTWSSKTFDIPLSAEAVPVRWVDRR